MLGGVSIQVMDSASVAQMAPLDSVSSARVIFEVPAGTAPGTATVSVVNGDNTKLAPATMIVAEIAPALFTADGSGNGVAAGTVAGAGAIFRSRNGACAAVPMHLNTDDYEAHIIRHGDPKPI